MQYNINVANGTGMEVRTNLNLAHQSLATNFFGATDPSLMSPVCAFPGSTWADTGNGLLKVRKADNSDWIVIGTIKSDGTPKLGKNAINTSELALNLRQPSTKYAVGDIAYSALLPSWAYIECAVGGTTSSGNLPVPKSVDAGTAFVDGTVTWLIRRIGSGRRAVGDIFLHAGNGTNPPGALLCDGSAVSRTMYPDLFKKIGTTYGAGDGATTFNLPNLSDNRFVEGARTAGTAKSAGLPNITGNYRVHGDQNSGFWSENISGACSGLAANGKSIGTSNYSADGLYYGFSFDASRSSSVYGNSATVQPKSLTLRFFIQAFDGQTPDSALIDITQYAQALAGKLPLSGGTMTGNIRMSAGNGIYSAVNNSSIMLNGGTTGNPATGHFNGAHLALYGKDSSAAGNVWLAADNGSQKCGLSLTPSGTASWKGIPLESLGMPSTTQIALNVPKDTSWVTRTYTAAMDGYVRANFQGAGITYSVQQGVMLIQNTTTSNRAVFMPIAKGTYTIACFTTDWTNKSATWSFVPTRGAL